MNAYQLKLMPNCENINDWWHSTSNPFRMCGITSMKCGHYLLMTEVNENNDAELDDSEWCEYYCVVQVYSPQAGDVEPVEDHETIDAGHDLLWVVS